MVRPCPLGGTIRRMHSQSSRARESLVEHSVALQHISMKRDARRSITGHGTQPRAPRHFASTPPPTPTPRTSNRIASSRGGQYPSVSGPSGGPSGKRASSSSGSRGPKARRAARWSVSSRVTPFFWACRQTCSANRGGATVRTRAQGDASRARSRLGILARRSVTPTRARAAQHQTFRGSTFQGGRKVRPRCVVDLA